MNLQKTAQLLGITRGNPWNFPVIATIAILIAVDITLLVGIFSNASAENRLSMGIAFMLTTILGVLPIGFLVMGSRRFTYIQRIVDGNYWVRWQYRAEARNRYQHYWRGAEVYISEQGVYWPAQKLTLHNFADGLIDVWKVEGEPLIQIKYKQIYRSRYSSHTEIKDLFILIPMGREIEAERVIEQLLTLKDKVTLSHADSYAMGCFIGIAVMIATFISLAVLLPLPGGVQQERRDTWDATTTAQWATENAVFDAELPVVQRLIEPNLARWREQATTTLQSVDPASIGFFPVHNIKEIMYGLCPDETFIVWVFQRVPTDRILGGDSGAYVYTLREGMHYSCMDAMWESTNSRRFGDGWMHVSLNTWRATAAPTFTALVAQLTQRAQQRQGSASVTPPAPDATRTPAMNAMGTPEAGQ